MCSRHVANFRAVADDAQRSDDVDSRGNDAQTSNEHATFIAKPAKKRVRLGITRRVWGNARAERRRRRPLLIEMALDSHSQAYIVHITTVFHCSLVDGTASEKDGSRRTTAVSRPAPVPAIDALVRIPKHRRCQTTDRILHIDGHGPIGFLCTCPFKPRY